MPVAARVSEVSASTTVKSEARRQAELEELEALERRLAADVPSEWTARLTIYALFDSAFPQRSPRWARASKVLAAFFVILILISCVLVCVESMPEFQKVSPRQDQPFRSTEKTAAESFLTAMEGICVICFTIDLVVRAVTTPKLKRFLTSFMNAIDLLAVAPWYIELIIGAGDGGVQLQFLRVIRMSRVLRVFKVAKYSDSLQMVGTALVKSKDALVLLGMLLVIFVLLFASAIFLAEQAHCTYSEKDERWVYKGLDGLDGVKTPFQSIFSSLWWAIVTLSTVGYGDDIPEGIAGKVVGMVCMMMGVYALAFPTVLIGDQLNEAQRYHNMLKRVPLPALPFAHHPTNRLREQ